LNIAFEFSQTFKPQCNPCQPRIYFPTNTFVFFLRKFYNDCNRSWKVVTPAVQTRFKLSTAAREDAWLFIPIQSM